MELYRSISQRKSCRAYANEPLAAEKLAEVKSALDGFETLYKDVPIQCRFATKTKGLYNIKAPQYVVASGTGKEGEMESAGFLLEQLVLWLDAEGMGSVWLGSSKDVDKNTGGKDLIVLAFGKADEPVHRELAEFKRKPIDEITNAPDDPCIQAVHLAPSGMNLQPWYLEKTQEKVILYQRILKGPVALAYDKVEVDMGIALCHYALACKHINHPFSFTHKKGESSRKGYQLFGEIA